MFSSHSKAGERLRISFARGMFTAAALAAFLWQTTIARSEAPTQLRERLKALPFKIAYEAYVEGNWEIFVANADGSEAVNLTATPKDHEHYPQISPDGHRICFLSNRQTRDPRLPAMPQPGRQTDRLGIGRSRARGRPARSGFGPPGGGPVAPAHQG